MTAPSATPGTIVRDPAPTHEERRPGPRGWPLDRTAGATLVAAWAVGVGLFTGLGLVLVGLLDGSRLGQREVALARWFEARRTPTLDRWSAWGSLSADTITKLVGIPLLAAILVVATRRWHDGVLLVTTMLLEVCVFGVATILVGRDRPPVEQLDGSLPTNSFPSGHVAAATACWLTLAIIVAWHTRSWWWRSLAAALAIVMPTVVATSRMYRGMHFLSDVIAGAVLGVVTVATTTLVLRAAVRRTARRHDRTAPAQASQLATTSGGEAT